MRHAGDRQRHVDGDVGDEQDEREPELPPDEPVDGQAHEPERRGDRRGAQDQVIGSGPSGHDPLLERLELGGGDLHAERVLVGAALGVAIREAAARACRGRLLRRSAPACSPVMLPEPEALLLRLVGSSCPCRPPSCRRLSSCRRWRGRRRPATSIAISADRLRVERDVLLVARLGGGRARQLLVGDLLSRACRCDPWSRGATRTCRCGPRGRRCGRRCFLRTSTMPFGA